MPAQKTGNCCTRLVEAWQVLLLLVHPKLACESESTCESKCSAWPLLPNKQVAMWSVLQQDSSTSHTRAQASLYGKWPPPKTHASGACAGSPKPLHIPVHPLVIWSRRHPRLPQAGCPWTRTPPSSPCHLSTPDSPTSAAHCVAASRVSRAFAAAVSAAVRAACTWGIQHSSLLVGGFHLSIVHAPMILTQHLRLSKLARAMWTLEVMAQLMTGACRIRSAKAWTH